MGHGQGRVFAATIRELGGVNGREVRAGFKRRLGLGLKRR